MTTTTMVRGINICKGIRNRNTPQALESLFHGKSLCHQRCDFRSTRTIFEPPLVTFPTSVRYSSSTIVSPRNKTTTARETTERAKPDVKIVEVGPRDGLQNEPLPLVSVRDKLEFIGELEQAGCSTIEVGSFVSPKWIPQMSGSADVLSGLLEGQGSSKYSVLVPNLSGVEQALSVENDAMRKGGRAMNEIAIFTAASEEFTKRNINSTIEESMQRFRDIVDRVKQARDDDNKKPRLLVRGYVSTVIACPYQGTIQPKTVAEVVEQMFELGCHEVSLGDTIGVGTPESTRRMLDEVLTIAKPSKLAMHCHDTYGQALVNILTGLEKEIYTIDSSVAGLGGCPYAKGASGNVATEDVLYMLHGMGLSTGIDLEKLFDAGRFICNVLDRPTLSKVAMASGFGSG